MLFPRGESRSEILESGTEDLDLSDDFFRVLDMVHFHDSDESPFSRGAFTQWRTNVRVSSRGLRRPYAGVADDRVPCSTVIVGVSPPRT